VAENTEAENNDKSTNNWKYKNHEKRNVRIQKRTKNDQWRCLSFETEGNDGNRQFFLFPFQRAL
jgi:hypothetical protein